MNAYSTPYRVHDCWKANTKVDVRAIVYFPCNLIAKTHGTAPWGASRLRARLSHKYDQVVKRHLFDHTNPSARIICARAHLRARCAPRKFYHDQKIAFFRFYSSYWGARGARGSARARPKIKNSNSVHQNEQKKALAFFHISKIERADVEWTFFSFWENHDFWRNYNIFWYFWVGRESDTFFINFMRSVNQNSSELWRKIIGV